MDVKCPVCGSMFEQSKLQDHILDIHSGSVNPETEAIHHAMQHKCVVCGATFPTAEALKAHNSSSHRM
jgi:DNA-directed RNA polymerase subunit RPC12/RpoP